MAVRRLYVIPGGFMELDKSWLTANRGMGQRVTVPLGMYLLQTDDGYILCDAGCDPRIITEGTEKVWGRGLARVCPTTMMPEDHPLERLRALGLGPQDIDFVVLTHLHFDHAGGVRFFPHARIVVQKAEYRFALFPDEAFRVGYFRGDFDYADLKYELLEGDKVLVAGVTLVATPGHTPGHQSIVVDLPQAGTVVLCGDAVDLKENIERWVGPGLAWDLGQAMLSMGRLKAIADRSQGQLWPSHDLEFWRSLRQAPAFYT